MQISWHDYDLPSLQQNNFISKPKNSTTNYVRIEKQNWTNQKGQAMYFPFFGRACQIISYSITTTRKRNANKIYYTCSSNKGYFLIWLGWGSFLPFLYFSNYLLCFKSFSLELYNPRLLNYFIHNDMETTTKKS